MNDFAKPFKTVEEQIKLLKSRNLIIEDEHNATTLLSTYSYYKLINGYQKPFWANTDYFISGANINSIWVLFCFDSFLRDLFLTMFLSLETKLKHIISYEYCKTYGELGYLNPNNYSKKADREKLETFLAIVDKIKKDSVKTYDDENLKCKENIKNKSVTHYMKTYGNVPLWVMMESLTFGNVSVFYELLDKKVRQNIAKKISDISKVEFSAEHIKSALKLLTLLRNTCAHGNPVYNFRTRLNISHNNKFVAKVIEQYPDLNINNLSIGFILIASILPEADVRSSFDNIDKYYRKWFAEFPLVVIEKIGYEFGFDLLKLISILKKEMYTII